MKLLLRSNWSSGTRKARAPVIADGTAAADVVRVPTALVLVVAVVLAVSASAAPPGADVPAAGDGSSDSMLSQLLMAAGILLIALTLLRAVRRRAAHRDDQQAPPRTRLEAIKTEAADRSRRDRPTSEAIVDPVGAATELAAMLDQRAARLEQLLADADARIARLETRGDDAKAERPGPEPGPAIDAAPAEPSEPSEPLATADVNDRRRLAARIHELAATGLGPLAIARAVEAPVGEVELVLALGPAVAGASAPETGEPT